MPTESETHLANTWKFLPDKPIAVIPGYPISCPSCGSSEGLRFWSHPDKETVSAEHTCIPFSFNGPNSKTRHWDEPRITKEFVRQHGVDLLSEFNEHLAPLARELGQRLRNR